MLATKEKSQPGFQLPTAALHPGFGFAISNTATEFDASVYDFCGGPLSSAYFRDSETGNDYAINRYHQPGMGRFLSTDIGPPTPASPGSWDRYAYVQGDPVNSVDKSGLLLSAQDCIADPEACEAEDSGCWAPNDFDPEPLSPLCYAPVPYVPAPATRP